MSNIHLGGGEGVFKGEATAQLKVPISERKLPWLEDAR